LWTPRPRDDDDAPANPRAESIAEFLRAHGASFFAPLHEAAGGGFQGDTVDALWDLVWRGAVTNDTLHPLRAFVARPSKRRGRPLPRAASRFHSRRTSPPAAQGRWSLIEPRAGARASTTERSAALAQQLLSRYGLITREVAAAEGISGGFGAIAPVLRALEDAGRIRRGYFVS